MWGREVMWCRGCRGGCANNQCVVCASVATYHHGHPRPEPMYVFVFLVRVYVRMCVLVYVRVSLDGVWGTVPAVVSKALSMFFRTFISTEQK